MAVTVPPDLRAHVESAALVTEPYGRDWRELLGDEDFTRMMRDPMGAIPQAVEYAAQVVAEKTATLVSMADGADLLVAGMTEQEAVARVAEYHRIPLAALHFFPTSYPHHGSPRAGAATQSDLAQRRALGLPDEPPRSDRALEIQAYDDICMPGLAAGWTDSAERRPFVGALTLQSPTDTDQDVLSWISGGPPPVYFGFGSMPIPGPNDMVAVISAACAQVDVRALICFGLRITLTECRLPIGSKSCPR